MSNTNRKFRVSFNSPVVLTFSIICLVALLLDFLTKGWANKTLFSVYRSSFLNPFTYFRLIGHVFGHADWEHFLGNITLILVVGPLLEEKYGSWNIGAIMFSTALVTGLVHILLFPNTMLLGASGIVFAFILLSSITSIKDGSIPITFILVAMIYIGEQIFQGLFVKSNISNLTHIVGGVLGATFGYVMNKNRIKRV
ncbi:MAG: rhomboid family intramembrane serine protease [Lachnospiraceae bacterium]|nr:rhomboid family intramembrane serine protease [Lachnospiraceae bacterium]